MTARRPLRPMVPALLTVATLLMVALLGACARGTAAPDPDAEPRPGSAEGAAGDAEPHALTGTNWQLVQILTADGQLLRPSDPSLYTLAFLEAGRVALRVDCNQAGGPWESPAAGELSIGPLIATLAACPPGSLAGEVVPAIETVGSYAIEEGDLRLGTPGSGASFLFEPAG